MSREDIATGKPERAVMARPTSLALLMAALACLVAACASAPVGAPVAAVAPDPTVIKASAPGAEPTSRPGEYRLGAGDKLRIQVFNDKDLSREYEIGDNGMLSMALIGQVRAAGLTVHEFEESLRASLRNGYIKDPKLSVEVMNYRPFYIFGEVNKPGEYPYKTGLNVLTAIAIAGGHSYRGNTEQVYIRRVGEADEKAYQAQPNVPVYAGDVVRIPERFF